MRAAAQLISYEIAQGLALVGVVMMAGTLSLTEIVEHQDTVWFVVPQFVGFLIFMIAGFGLSDPEREGIQQKSYENADPQRSGPDIPNSHHTRENQGGRRQRMSRNQQFHNFSPTPRFDQRKS